MRRERKLVPVVTRRRLAVMIAAFCLGGIVVSAALADSNYLYFSDPTTPSGQGGGDQTNYYRYYNDSCSGDGYAWTKSIYGLSDGTWVVQTESYNACGFNKAHLGPSGNYGYSSVQSKCRNTSAGSIYLICNTSRP